MDWNSNNKGDMNDIALLQCEKNKQCIRLYCKKIQYQNMIIERLKHSKQVYVEIYEQVVEYQLKITSLLQKISVKIYSDYMSNVTRNDQKDIEDFSQSIEMPEVANKAVQTFIKSIDQFQYEPSQNAMHVSFDYFSNIQLGNRQRIMKKYLELQALEQTLEETKYPSGHKKDMDALETQQIAEKFFI